MPLKKWRENIVPELRETELEFLKEKPPNNFGLIEIDWKKEVLKFTAIDSTRQSLGDAFSYALPFFHGHQGNIEKRRK